MRGSHPFCLAVLCLALALASCAPDEAPPPEPEPAPPPLPEASVIPIDTFALTTALILNAGSGTADDAEISTYSYEPQRVANNIFFARNRRPLGRNATHMHWIGKRLYVVLNGSNRIEILDTTLRSTGVIAGLQSPRTIFSLSKDWALISEWTLGSPSGTVAVLNVASGMITQRIAVEAEADRFYQIDSNQVWLMNPSGSGNRSASRFMYSNGGATITKLSPLVFSGSPTSVAIRGYGGPAVGIEGTNRIILLNGDGSATDSVQLSASPRDLLTISGQFIYYGIRDSVYRFDVWFLSDQTNPFFIGNFFNFSYISNSTQIGLQSSHYYKLSTATQLPFARLTRGAFGFVCYHAPVLSEPGAVAEFFKNDGPGLALRVGIRPIQGIYRPR